MHERRKSDPLRCRLILRQIGRQDLDRHLAVEARVVGRVDDPHAALADLGGDFIRAEARAWAEGHVGYGNGGAILPPVGLTGTHHGRAGFAGSGAASPWLSKAHVWMLSDDPVDLRGQGRGQAGREPLGRGDEGLQLLVPVTALAQPCNFETPLRYNCLHEVEEGEV